MKRVLVTGASGFIGRHTLPLLAARGYEVHAVSSRAPAADLPAAQWHRADLLDAARVRALIADVAPTHLLHFAWDVEPDRYRSAPANVRWVQAGLDLLQAFVAAGGQRVVMAGTCAEYDWQYGRCSEAATPLLPATLYGTCKLALAQITLALAPQVGISAAWGRIFFLYGPHEHPDRLVASVIRALLAGEPARCSHGNQIRDFLYVQDVADAFVALLDSELNGTVNVASGRGVAIKLVVGLIADRLQRPDLLLLGAIQAAAGDPPALFADVGRLTVELGWRPKHTLADGLDQTIAWWANALKMGTHGRVG